jgi:DnaJ-class molecular chaperone
MQRIR